MTDREKIIELFHKAKKADVICHRDGAELEWSDLEDFYRAAQAEAFERAAAVCETSEIPIDIDVWMGTKKALTAATAIGLATAIRALKEK